MQTFLRFFWGPDSGP